MSMTEQEKIVYEKEIRYKILMEQRERKAEWRRNNKESVRRSNRKYYLKKKAEKEAQRYEQQDN